MRCLCRTGRACFFLFCLSPVSLNRLFLSGDETSFLSPGVGCCPRIRSQLGHTPPTGPVWGFAGVASLPWPQIATQGRPGPSLKYLSKSEFTPPPKGGGAGSCSTFGSLDFQCREARYFFAGKDGHLVSEGFSRQLPLATAAHNCPHGFNRACLGLPWCRFPTLSPKPHTGPHGGEFGFGPLAGACQEDCPPFRQSRVKNRAEEKTPLPCF